jgi:molybdate transport system regulatory protein
MDGVRLTVRIDFGAQNALGPGKIRLLEAIGRTSSIAQAGRSLHMSYRRAWLLVDDLNRSFRKPVVSKQSGGRRGGGAILTSFGRSLIGHYRTVEKKRRPRRNGRCASCKRRCAVQTPASA